MDLALMSEPHLGGTYADQLAAAQWAEEAGLTAFARCDHLYSGREPTPDATDAFSVLAGLARETSSIELTVLVAPITFRHPAIIAKSAATIDQMSEGRFRLGVGTGWMELEHRVLGIPFPPSSERWERLEEAVRYLRATIDSDRPRFEGKHYSIDGTVTPQPKGLSLIIGGSGSHRTPRLAGSHADEYNHFAASPEVLAPKIRRVREAAAGAGRDPDSIRMSVMGPVLVGRDRADYHHRLAALAKGRGRSPAEQEEVLRRAGIPRGTRDEAQSHLSDLARAGVDLFYVQFLDVSDLDGIVEQIGLLR